MRLLKRMLLILPILFLVLTCSSDDETTPNPDQDNPVYLDENGITIKAYTWAKVGEKGSIGGITYTIVDESMLREMVENGEDVTKVCTTRITDMSQLFYDSSFNEDLSSWDVSNVTDMSEMFRNDNEPNPFNRDIRFWDVGKVTDMSGMFQRSAFDQNINSWDVRNVKTMSRMFSEGSFNQPIGNWDVSNVTDMSAMFAISPFNQPIENWDVSKVTDMSSMFSNVTIFGGLIENSFNQDIGSWDVSNVTDMTAMFGNSSFNQDLNSWNVDNVINCSDFNRESYRWTLPKPNFINCDPGNEPKITTMTITLSPQGGGETITLDSDISDGSGMSVSGNLTANTDYNATIVLLDKAQTPAINITEIVEQESDQYQFFFMISGGLNAGTTYTNFDGNGNPIGTEFVLATGAASGGTFTATLRYQPKKPNDGTLADAGGETRYDLTFPLVIE